MVDMVEGALSGKRVLLTGHTGFKGSWMVYCLSRLGAEVLGYSLAPAERSLYPKIDGDALCTSIIADVCEAETLATAVEGFQPEIVLHFAALSLVRESYRAPLETFATNVIGTANLLEALKGVQGPCAVVVVTTDKVYENKEWDYPYRETDALGGHDPYSSSKACTEIVAASYRKAFFDLSRLDEHGIAIATARAGNVIGGGDWNNEHLVPDIITALSDNEVLQIRSPRAIRPWQHVLEPLFGYLLLAARLSESPTEVSRAWNFGPDLTDNVTVESFVQRAIAQWGDGRYEATPADQQMHEATLLKLDISATKNRLGWVPCFTVDDAITYTVEWYRDFLDNPSRVMELMDRDFGRYVQAAACSEERDV